MTNRRLAWQIAALAVLMAVAVSACGAAPHKSSSSQAHQRDVQGGKPAANGSSVGKLRGASAQDGVTPQGVFATDSSGRSLLQSTFALDVDTASYGYARRALLDGRLPGPQTVRPEEFVNFFKQDYPEPTGNGFTITADGVRGSGETSDVRLLRVGLRTRSADLAERKDAALTFVIDVSGSMAEPGRLDLVQDALHTLVDQLRPTDSVAIVAYSTTARVIRAMAPVSSRRGLHDAINRLRTAARTNLEAGLVSGYRVARQGFRNGATNRVILLSDGLPNLGDVNADAILSQVREEAGNGIALLCVGVGSQYGDHLMEQLADKGDGFAVYVSQRAQARRIFTQELPATIEVRAQDAKAQVTFDTATVESARLIGFDDRRLDPEQFRNDAVAGGEIGPGHTVTALYEVTLRPDAGNGKVADAAVRWIDPDTQAPSEISRTITVADLGTSLWSAPSPRFQVDVVAALFAESLHTGSGPFGLEFGTLASQADRLAEVTEDPDVADLANLIHRAENLRS